MTAIHLKEKIDEALRKYTEEHCLNISKWIHKLVKEKLEKEGITIGKSDDPSKNIAKSD